jgi:hypothetical protein
MEETLKQLEAIKRKREIDKVIEGDYEDYSEGTN